MDDDPLSAGREPVENHATAPGRPRFDWREWSAAFADLGTFIPFVVAYVSVLKMDPVGILLAFGVALICCGFLYRTPVPVQPMKAIGAVAASQASMVTGGSVMAASMVTGVVWLLLGLTGTATRLARVIPREVVLGIMLDLGISFMLQGLRMMDGDWPAAAVAFLVAVMLRKSRLFPAVIMLLIGGVAYGAVLRPEVWHQARFAFAFRLPEFTLHELALNDFVTGALLLALPQVPLTLGNAVIGLSEENNRLFPGRPTTVRKVTISTGAMNLAGGLVGGIPMCRGAGGMAAYTAFGARSGGAPIIFGVTLTILALFFSGSIEFLLQAVPGAVLGTILFLAGGQLVKGNTPGSTGWRVLLPVAFTAGAAAWNVALGFLVGFAVHRVVNRQK